MSFSAIVVTTFLVAFGSAGTAVIIHAIAEDVKYYKEAKAYGKNEGEIIKKDYEIVLRSAPIPPFDYYFEIQKEEDGKKITRKLYVQKEDYIKFNVGDHIIKEKHEAIVKAN